MKVLALLLFHLDHAQLESFLHFSLNALLFKLFLFLGAGEGYILLLDGLHDLRLGLKGFLLHIHCILRLASQILQQVV